MKIVLADLGGTNIRLAVSNSNLSDNVLEKVENSRCDAFASAEEVLASYCDRNNIQPDALVLGVAAEMTGDIVDVTNNCWQFHGDAVARACGASRYMLINDFCAQALAHRDLLLSSFVGRKSPSRQTVRSGQAQPMTPLLVSGPGTGLGMAALVPTDSEVMVIEGEGGHVSFAAVNDFEKRLQDKLQNQWGHVSAERIVSGPGLEMIYSFMTGKNNKSAPKIGAAALAGVGVERDAVNVMLTAFATILANAALSFGAGSGIVIAGGIIPKLYDLLPESGFFERLHDHGRRSLFLANLPLYISTDQYSGLMGANFAAKNPCLAHRWKTA